MSQVQATLFREREQKRSSWTYITPTTISPTFRVKTRKLVCTCVSHTRRGGWSFPGWVAALTPPLNDKPPLTLLCLFFFAPCLSVHLQAAYHTKRGWKRLFLYRPPLKMLLHARRGMQMSVAEEVALGAGQGQDPRPLETLRRADGDTREKQRRQAASLALTGGEGEWV